MAFRRFGCGWVVVVATVIAELSHTPAAQAPLLPAATLRVNAGWTNQTWPADFNEDGVTDLATSVRRPGGVLNVQIAIGRGDGTFAVPVVSDATGFVAAVADLNRDGFIDVVSADEDRLVVTRGNGNGTLGTPNTLTVNQGGPLEWVLALDLDGDGSGTSSLPPRTTTPAAPGSSPS